MVSENDGIIFDHKEVNTGGVSRNAALSKMMMKDAHHVISDDEEKKELLNALRAHGDDDVTKGEMRGILASFKYGQGSNFSRREVDMLARDLSLGNITEKHLPVKSYVHNTHLDRARHVVSYVHNAALKKIPHATQKRIMPSDDVTHFEINEFLREKLPAYTRKDIVSGEMMYVQEDENYMFKDQSGKKVFLRTSHVARPDLPVKSQTSLRGRGMITSPPGM